MNRRDELFLHRGEGVHAVVAPREAVIGGQDRLGVRAGEVDRAGIAGGRVVKLVLGRDREAKGRACRGASRSADDKMAGRRGIDQDAVAGAGDG